MGGDVAGDAGGSLEIYDLSDLAGQVEPEEPVAAPEDGGGGGEDGGSPVTFTDEQFTELLDAITRTDEEEDGEADESDVDGEEPEDEEEDEVEEDAAADGEDLLVYEEDVEAGAEVPEDFYALVSDLQTQQTFYQSLIFGVLVLLCFVIGLNGRK